MKRIIFILLLVGVQTLTFAQENTYKVGCIGFYNFENLFDTLDAPDIRDEEFTPTGAKLYGTQIYQQKLSNLARVVSELGTELTPDGVALLGVSEIENRKVLEDFVIQPEVKDRNYQIIHFDSPDERGIDVALLYQPKYFQPTHSEALFVELYRNGEPDYTRDVLYVAGMFDGEEIHILVNHWPSRSGGESASSHLREKAASVCKQVVDSLTALNSSAKIVIMGDLNDDPTSPSVQNVLQAKRKLEQVRPRNIFNPMYALYKKGYGSLAWRDSWNLFDQILITSGLVDKEQNGYFFHKVRVYNERYLRNKTGQYKGYPMRSFVGDTFINGYSDHFPVYMFLLKKVP